MNNYIYRKSDGKPTTVEKLTTTFKQNGRIESTREIIKFLEGMGDNQLLADILNFILSRIPEAASASNKLADKAYVNEKVATDSATFRGSYNLVTDLSLTTAATQAEIGAALGTVISTADNNDFCYVQIPADDTTPTALASVDRYKYNGTDWTFEYSLDKSLIAIKTSDITALTDAQCNALRNGDIVTKVTGTEKHTYVVTYKDDTKGEMALVYCDYMNIEEVYYEVRNGSWTYIQTDNFNFNDAIGAVIDTMNMDENNGDITIQYEE